MDPASANREDAISKILLVIGLVLVAGAILVYYFSPQFQSASPAASSADADAGISIPEPVIPEIRGKPVAEFSLPDLNGKLFTPADFTGKVVLVNFWATWCGPCLIEIPWFLEFQERYGPEGFEVLAISMDEEGPSVVEPFVEKHEMAPLTVVMGDESTPGLFGGLLGFPTTFMVDREGNYYSKHQGLVSKQDIEDEILILLGTSGSGQPAVADSAELEPSREASSGPTG